MAALFVIAKMWKPPRRLSTDKWIKKMLCVCIYISYIYMIYICNIYMMPYYSAIKKD